MGPGPPENPTPSGLVGLFRQYSELRRRADERGDLPLTEAGESAAEELNRRLTGALSAEALARGHRRRASMLDRTDFEAAYDEIVNPRDRPLWLRIGTDLGVLFAGVFIAVGVNRLTETAPRFAIYGPPLAAGIFVGAFCVPLKYLRP